jgi:hypothetical protein
MDYKAKICGLDINAQDLKEARIIMPISIGQDYH